MLDRHVDTLTHSLRRASLSPPTDVATGLWALPLPDVLPLPWNTWLLFALVRYSISIRSAGRVAAGDAPAAAPTIWVPQFRGYLDAQHPRSPEARLLQLHRYFEAVRLPLDELMKGGLIHRGPKWGGTSALSWATSPYILTDQTMELAELVIDFCDRWQDPQQHLWLAGLIGDWLLVRDLASEIGDPRLVHIASERADACIRLRSRPVLRRARSHQLRAAELAVIADQDPSRLREELRRTLYAHPREASLFISGVANSSGYLGVRAPAGSDLLAEIRSFAPFGGWPR